MPGAVAPALRRAFNAARNGRPRPALVEIPSDLFGEDLGELDYRPVVSARSAPDPQAVDEAAQVLVDADRPLIYAGQGVHYAEAWAELRELAELLEAPVTTSLEGKERLPRGPSALPSDPAGARSPASCTTSCSTPT